MELNDFLLIFLKKLSDSNIELKIPSERFWSYIILLIQAGFVIKSKGHILTKEDCYIEMEDCALGDISGKTRILLLWLNQKRKYFGW